MGRIDMIKGKKAKRQMMIMNKFGKSSDERRVKIFQRAFTISVGYIYLYSLIEIIWKSILSKSVTAGMIDIIRLVTMFLVYIFFLYDNKAFGSINEDSYKKSILENLKIVFARKKDERLYQISGLANTIVFFYTFLFLLIEILYKIINKSSLDMIWMDYVLFISMIVLVSILMKEDESYGLPIDGQGEVLDKETKKCAKQRRILYVKQSMSYTLGIFIISILVGIITKGKVNLFPFPFEYQSNNSYFIYLGNQFVFELFIIFGFHFLYGEYKVKKYNKKQENSIKSRIIKLNYILEKE